MLSVTINSNPMFESIRSIYDDPTDTAKREQVLRSINPTFKIQNVCLASYKIETSYNDRSNYFCFYLSKSEINILYDAISNLKREVELLTKPKEVVLLTKPKKEKNARRRKNKN